MIFHSIQHCANFLMKMGNMYLMFPNIFTYLYIRTGCRANAMLRLLRGKSVALRRAVILQVTGTETALRQYINLLVTYINLLVVRSFLVAGAESIMTGLALLFVYVSNTSKILLI